MLLKKFSCTYYPPYNRITGDSIVFEEIAFQSLNLIVGKNASGKSMLVEFINALAKAQEFGNPFPNWEFSFADNMDSIEYTIGTNNRNLSEILTINGKEVIRRNGGSGEIYSATTERVQTISPPMNEFVINTRRDAKEYPYIENVLKWRDGIHFFRFGFIHPYSFGGVNEHDDSLTSIKGFNKIIGEFTDSDFEKIRHNLNTIGFKIDSLYTEKNGAKNILLITENGFKGPVMQFAFSQGMFRAVFLLIFIHYLTEKVGAGMIIVDDLCEGMDYERASKLGKLIYETLESKNIQFIATSNDSFLMNVVDVKYWNILHREGNHIGSYNITNSKEKFDKFKKSGLNNFDLFSSDFLDGV